MQRNYLLRHIQRDSLATIVFSVAFGLLGLSPWYLVQGHEPSDGGLRAAGAMAGLCGLFGLYLARHAFNPVRESSIQALARFGPVLEVLGRIQSEYEQGKPTRFGRICLLPNWLTACGVGVTVVRLDDLVGVELQETRNRINGVSAGSTWQLLVYTNDQRCLEVRCPNHFSAQALVPLLAMRSPWAKCGPQADLSRRWSVDRVALLAEVEQARSLLEGLADP